MEKKILRLTEQELKKIITIVVNEAFRDEEVDTMPDPAPQDTSSLEAQKKEKAGMLNSALTNFELGPTSDDWDKHNWKGPLVMNLVSAFREANTLLPKDPGFPLLLNAVKRQAEKIIKKAYKDWLAVKDIYINDTSGKEWKEMNGHEKYMVQPAELLKTELKKSVYRDAEFWAERAAEEEKSLSDKPPEGEPTMSAVIEPEVTAAQAAAKAAKQKRSKEIKKYINQNWSGTSKQGLAENKKSLKEELTKEDVKKVIRDEITAFARQQLKKMVEEELEKALAKTDIKNKVGDISKDILKKLYKDLSLHHTYVIDRVKL